MNCTETSERPELSVGTECLVEMPFGLLGFEQYKSFALVTKPEEEPFLWLQSVDEPKLAFLVMSPFGVVPNYQPELANEDEQFLELQGVDDALVFAIVSVRNAHHATLNLKGPIVLNRRTRRAKQVIPLNAPTLPVAYPLPVLSA